MERRLSGRRDWKGKVADRERKLSCRRYWKGKVAYREIKLTGRGGCQVEDTGRGR